MIRASLLPFGKLVGLLNLLEPIWTSYVLFSGFSVGLFITPPWLPPAPWWALPAILLLIVFAIILLGAAYGCLVGSRIAFPVGTAASLGMLLDFTGMIGIVPNDYLVVAIFVCVVAVVGNAFAWLRLKSNPLSNPT